LSVHKRIQTTRNDQQCERPRHYGEKAHGATMYRHVVVSKYELSENHDTQLALKKAPSIGIHLVFSPKSVG